MKNKRVTLTATLITLMGLSLLVAAQSKLALNKEIGDGVVKPALKLPLPKAETLPSASATLRCETKNKEFNQTIYVTNTTGAMLPAGKLIKYSIFNKQSSFKLSAALPANATLAQESIAYTGGNTCKAWY